MVDFLVSRRGDVRASNALGGGALSAAATTGQAAVARRLVAARGDVAETDHAGARRENGLKLWGECQPRIHQNISKHHVFYELWGYPPNSDNFRLRWYPHKSTT